MIMWFLLGSEPRKHVLLRLEDMIQGMEDLRPDTFYLYQGHTVIFINFE